MAQRLCVIDFERLVQKVNTDLCIKDTIAIPKSTKKSSRFTKLDHRIKILGF